MQSSRLKNIIILILLLTNLSLAAVVVSRQADHQKGLEQVRQQLVTLFAAENVELDEDLISTQTPPLSRTLTRDTQQEEDLAAILLGKNLRWSDQGGGIHLYGSDRGGVQFLDNGSFDAAGSLSEGASAPEVCRAFCKEFGYGDLTFSSDGTSATAVQYCDGYPVVNCTVSFTLDSGGLLTVTGTHLPDAYTESAPEEAPLSAAAALDAFLNNHRKSQTAVSKITDVYLCFELQSSASAAMTLVPAWCIVTDISGLNYYVNCITGAVTHS